MKNKPLEISELLAKAFCRLHCSFASIFSRGFWHSQTLQRLCQKKILVNAMFTFFFYQKCMWRGLLHDMKRQGLPENFLTNLHANSYFFFWNTWYDCKFLFFHIHVNKCIRKSFLCSMTSFSFQEMQKIRLIVQ